VARPLITLAAAVVVVRIMVQLEVLVVLEVVVLERKETIKLLAQAHQTQAVAVVVKHKTMEHQVQVVQVS
jgi:hypothetical protein